MTRRYTLPLLALALAACGGGGGSSDRPRPAPPPVVASNPMDPNAWEITHGNLGSPMRPFDHPDGVAFDIPGPSGQANYVTFVHGSLAGKSRIVLRYYVEADPGVQIYPEGFPGSPSVLSLYFQRKGDNWTARGAYEAYRWYSSGNNHTPITTGPHELSVSLDENWTAILTSSALTNPTAFADAKRYAERVGFVLGGGSGLGHGVYATGSARLVITHFSVE